ncbi:MAG: ABC transporter ATP-binding protein [Anaerolineaceae bacterium]|nr:ABC transporter ATP-binding protein [Anaerolineaceae bacterium]
MTAIMGPSGSGKSTLLYNVSGMDQADSGEVWLGGTEIVRLSEDDKARLRLRKMGFVFQQMNMLSNLNILDNILLPSAHANKSRSFQKEQKEKALQLMEQFGIRKLSDRRITEVSGGQLQRACICRSMMLSPQILFADEPTGALNQTASEEVLRAFSQINDNGTTILMVTHDSRVAAKCRRILYILDGEIRGELNLGTYSEDKIAERQKKTADWLKKMGW